MLKKGGYVKALNLRCVSDKLGQLKIIKKQLPKNKIEEVLHTQKYT